MCQVGAQRIQVTLRLLDLGELLGTTSFCDNVDGQLVGSSAANKVGKVGELEGRSGLGGLGCRGDSRSRGDLLFQGLRLTAELRQERAGLVGDGRRRGDGGQAL